MFRMGYQKKAFSISLKKKKAAQLRFAMTNLEQTKTFGIMSFKQTRPKWSCLAITHSTKFGENQTSAQMPNSGSVGVHLVFTGPHSVFLCFVFSLHEKNTLRHNLLTLLL